MTAVPPHRARATVSAILLVMGLSGCAEVPAWLRPQGTDAPQAAAVPAAQPRPDSESVPVAQLAFALAPQREDLVPPSPTCSPPDDWLEHASLLQGGIEEGVASWYGRRRPRRRNGKVMTVSADRQRFDPMAMTAAHRTLPFGTQLRVTNLVNGRTVVVRINDRGPQSRKRILDLSYGAAEELGMVRAGTTRVSVRLIALGGVDRPALPPRPEPDGC